MQHCLWAGNAGYLRTKESSACLGSAYKFGPSLSKDRLSFSSPPRAWRASMASGVVALSFLFIPLRCCVACCKCHKFLRLNQNIKLFGRLANSSVKQDLCYWSTTLEHACSEQAHQSFTEISRRMTNHSGYCHLLISIARNLAVILCKAHCKSPW